MDIYEGDTGPCSRESSIGNFLDEGLGTSLDGTDEEKIHSTLGRNDSGVFDEMTTSSPTASQGTNSISVDSSVKSVSHPTGGGVTPNTHTTTSSSSSSPTVPHNNNNNNSSSVDGGGIVSNNNNNSNGGSGGNNNHHKKKNSSPNRHSGPQRCAICGKIFSNASALTKHKLTHSDERKHACSVCGKAFKRQDHLNGHMLTHRRQKPFECRAKGCGKSYCDGRSLRRHIESRHGAEALATLTIQATPSNSPSKNSVSPGIGNNNNNNNPTDGDVQGILSVTSTDRSLPHPHIMVVGGEENGGLVMETDVVNCCLPNSQQQQQQQQEHILTLDSNLNLLEHNYGTSMDIQVTLPPVIVQDDKHPSVTKHTLDHPIHGVKSGVGGGILGLTFSPSTGTVRCSAGTELCSITVRDSILRNSGSTSTTTTAGTKSQSSSSSLTTTTVSGSGQGVAVTTVPVTIRTSHSQLHQLLTQRAANAGLGLANLAKNASLVTINPGNLTQSPTTPCHPQQQQQLQQLHHHESGVTTYASNWTTSTPSSEHHEIQMTKMSDDRTNDGGMVSVSVPRNSNGTVNATTTTLLVTTTDGVGGSGKSPSIPISASLSCSPTDMDMTLTPPTTTATTMTTGGGGGSNTTSSPTLLKEQLELIHQIIQQAQEESNLTAAAAAAASNSSNPKSALGKASKGTSKKTKSQGGLTNCGIGGGNGIVIKIEAGEETIKSFSGSSSSDDKPVECTICCRRFKNTPALNGHMRLHGGYFKKDADGKRKDVISSSKESSSTPLQTASVSVRALIEEKIIQKRNTQSQSQGIEKALAVNTVHSTQGTSTVAAVPPPADSQIVFSENQSSEVQQQQQQQQQQETLSVGLTLPDSLSTSSSVSSTFNLSTVSSQGSSQNLRFVYGDDNTDYLLMDEEVLNKCYESDFLCQVSNICPDSFLNAIDESILNNSGNDQFPPEEWNWAASLGTDSNQHFVKLQSSLSSDSPVTPLPPLDASLYASSTPQSPSVHSQDSPSFMYPIHDMSNVIVALTPPASLESHNALQSPLFPFPQTTPTSQQQQMTVVLPFETQTSSYSGPGSLDNSLVPSGPASTDLLDGSTLNLNNFSSLITATTIPDGISSVILGQDGSTNATVTGGGTLTCSGSVVGSGAVGGGGEQLENVRQFVSVQKESGRKKSRSGGVTTSELNILTPSNSPSLAAPNNMDDPLLLQSVKECKVNETSRMDCAGGSGVFLNPNSVPSSPCLKSSDRRTGSCSAAKRKQLRNTFASNLRPQTTSPYKSQSQFTPYPILSPVRSAPGLYWTFSTKLSHVDDTKKEVPRINIGSNFQATLPECSLKRNFEDLEDDQESRLWNPECLEFCSPEDVQNYLELACSSAIPGGGRNKEYALHILSSCKGDINTAIFLLMNPNPNSLPNNLKKYKYQETKKWCRQEINIFQEALLRYGKDFVQVAKEIEGKSTKECVIFYQLWKKVCSAEYEKVRSVCKKRDASFLLGLESLHNYVPNQMMTVAIPLSDVTSGHNYPCKVCSKIFSKVKSRSAHMKSHGNSMKANRTDNSDGTNSKSTGNKKLKAANKTKNPVTTTGDTKANNFKTIGSSPPSSSSSSIVPELSNCSSVSWPAPQSSSSSSLPTSSFTQGGPMTPSSYTTISPLRSALVKQQSSDGQSPLVDIKPVIANLGTGECKMSRDYVGCESSSSSSQLPGTTIPMSSPTTNSSSSISNLDVTSSTKDT